jgi:hypothetical protein
MGGVNICGYPIGWYACLHILGLTFMTGLGPICGGGHAMGVKDAGMQIGGGHIGPKPHWDLGAKLMRNAAIVALVLITIPISFLG